MSEYLFIKLFSNQKGFNALTTEFYKSQRIANEIMSHKSFLLLDIEERVKLKTKHEKRLIKLTQEIENYIDVCLMDTIKKSVLRQLRESAQP